VDSFIKEITQIPNRDLMGETNFNIYCNAWCAIHVSDYAYETYQHAGDGGIIFC
jgi:hypothetical protein